MLERALYVYPFEIEVHRRLADLYQRLGHDAAAMVAASWPAKIEVARFVNFDVDIDVEMCHRF